MLVEIAYLLYLLISIGVTVYVGNVLSKNGSLFLINCFEEKEELANAINQMLLVGFYLINIGFVSLALGYGDTPYDSQTAIVYVSTKIGFSLLVLGVMHLSIMLLISIFKKTMKSSISRA